MGAILHKVQQIPVERGTVEAARSLDRLIAALDAGGAVIIYPEGTITKEPRALADARQDRRGPAGAGHRRPGDPAGDVGAAADVRPAWRPA